MKFIISSLLAILLVAGGALGSIALLDETTLRARLAGVGLTGRVPDLAAGLQRQLHALAGGPAETAGRPDAADTGETNRGETDDRNTATPEAREHGGGNASFLKDLKRAVVKIADALDPAAGPSASLDLPPIHHVTQQSAPDETPLAAEPEDEALAEPSETEVASAPVSEPFPPEETATSEPEQAAGTEGTDEAKSGEPPLPLEPAPAETAAAEPEPPQEVGPPLEPPPDEDAGAPAAPPLQTEEERLAAADLDYKRGLRLYSQTDGDTNAAEAAKLFAKAAVNGHSNAQYTLGVMYFTGRGLAKDLTKAVTWFTRAADRDHAAAQYNLGLLYFKGQGVAKNDELAFKWIARAAANGDKKAAIAREALAKSLPADVVKAASPPADGTVSPATN